LQIYDIYHYIDFMKGHNLLSPKALDLNYLHSISRKQKALNLP